MSQQEAWAALAALEAERNAMLEANYQSGRPYGVHDPRALRAITKQIALTRCEAQGINHR